MCRKRFWLLSIFFASSLLVDRAGAQPVELPALRKLAGPEMRADDGQPIDLPTALRLGGVDNPEIQLARQRVVEALALRQLAAAQFLPTLNSGGDIDHHLGPVQQSNGTILKVDRDSLYVGMGANALRLGDGKHARRRLERERCRRVVWCAVSRQVVRQRSFESEAIRNAMLLQVASAYLELLRATGRQAVAAQVREDAAEVARVTAAFVKAKAGRQADADRAAAELEQRNSDVIQARSDMLVASARLCQLLSLDPAVRLAPMESQILPTGLVPEPIPLPELLAIALMQRPELRQQQAAVRAAMLDLEHAKILPFSPQVLVGYSAGTFGGGSNLIAPQQPRFGNFADREDVDVVVYWSLRNLGVGNLALIRLSRSQLRQSQLRQIETLDRIRAEVASSRARMVARFAQIETNEKAIQSAQAAFQEDQFRTLQNKGLPIEVLDSFRLLARSRFAYLDAIVDYNRAQFELYVALGQPPAGTLARPVPLGAPVPTTDK